MYITYEEAYFYKLLLENGFVGEVDQWIDNIAVNNDTLEGIKNNLRIISDYNVLGNNLGMLTDSRSFSSYSRFDFFRRILCSFVGEFVIKGEYPLEELKS